MEKNKTTMQNLWNYIDANCHEENFNIHKIREVSLEMEKEQTKDAWNDGYEKGLRTREEKISNPAFDAETYYANNYDTTKGLPEEDSKRRAWHY